MRGWLNAIRQSSSGQALVAAYSRLHGALAYYQTIQVLDFDAEAYECYMVYLGLFYENQIRHLQSQDLPMERVLMRGAGKDADHWPGLGNG